jgi:YVTN family beta-propeller protein
MLISLALVLPTCGGGGNPGPNDNRNNIDVSGVWAGTWSGTDPAAGTVTGNWEAEVSQTESAFNGQVLLSGDVDCTDGSVAGSVGPGNVISGTLSRPGCQHHEWTLTALNSVEKSASGTWTQPAFNANGTFTGTQIAAPGGPRISFFSPPGGIPGAFVTVVGSGFAPAVTGNTLIFSATPAELLAADSATLITRVPQGASSGPLALTTSQGTAYSPRPFNTAVTYPKPVVNNYINAGGTSDGVAFSPDGRRAFVTVSGGGSVAMISTKTEQILSSTPVVSTVQGIAASPDGRRVYVASGSSGITVLHAGTNTPLDTISIPAGEGVEPNPQGLAISPDGRVLYVSNNIDGGTFTVVDVASKQVMASVYRGTGTLPLGVGVSPDGLRAYMAFSGANVIDVFDLASRSILATIPVGSRPVGVAVSPDGGKVYVSNELDNSVSVIDAILNNIIKTVPVGSAPAAIAISPDSAYAYVACRGSSAVTVIDTLSDSVVTTASAVPSPSGIAISADGKRAYVTSSTGSSITQIGGLHTLTILKGGTGIGTVTSDPVGIDCGTNCQSSFDLGTVVVLRASPDSSSSFEGWSGDPDCSDGVVTLDANKNCTATFNVIPKGSGGSGPGCFIATATYGSYLDPHVQVLREFRDKHLITNRLGRRLVDYYNTYSPSLAEYIAKREGLRKAVRIGLTPTVFCVKYPVFLLIPAVMIFGIVVLRKFKKRKGIS